jgi:hypothetical protein
MQMETTCHCLCGAWLKTPPATVFRKPGHVSCKSTFQLSKGGCLRGAAYVVSILRLFVAGRSLVYRLNRVGARTEPWGRPLRWDSQLKCTVGLRMPSARYESCLYGLLYDLPNVTDVSCLGPSNDSSPLACPSPSLPGTSHPLPCRDTPPAPHNPPVLGPGPITGQNRTAVKGAVAVQGTAGETPVSGVSRSGWLPPRCRGSLLGVNL